MKHNHTNKNKIVMKINDLFIQLFDCDMPDYSKHYKQ